MNTADASIRNRVSTLTITAVLIVGGYISYQKLGRLEDPEFTIKEAQVITSYPGASAAEVAEEVTDRLETAIQQMGQLELVTSISKPGLSIIRAEMKDRYDKKTLPQVWDELRRKVNDARGQLPPGCGAPVVNDDFGDVYGIFFGLYGDGYSYAELLEYAKLLRRELLLVPDVAKVALYGDQPEAVYLEISRARLAQLGLSPETIYQTLARQNEVSPSGRVEIGSQYVRIRPTGEFASVEDLANLLILENGGAGTKLYLRDIATVRRGYVEPPKTIMRCNGRRAIGLGISTVQGGNVVTMGEGVKKRMRELASQLPIGIEFGVVSVQADSVTASINSFVVSLIEAVLIVIAVLLLSMGLRSGLLIGVVLLLTILGTFIIMKSKGVLLERISLGALIIALGMLVDNAIVVVEGILVGIQRGQDAVKAAIAVVKQTAWPLLAATVVAILAFAAIGVSQDSTGEYCRSLFQVIFYSLGLSWILAITVTPLLGVMYLKGKKGKKGKKSEAEVAPDVDPYQTGFFRVYRRFLVTCLKLRWIVVAVMVGALVLATIGFKSVTQSFFPASTRPQFLVHCWLPQGTHILQTEAGLTGLESFLMQQEGVTGVSSFVGQGALRFILTYAPEEPNTAYGLLIVSVEDYRRIPELMAKTKEFAGENMPNAEVYARAFVLGPGEAQKIQVRFRGPDLGVLRRLAEEAKAVFHGDPHVADVADDWRERVPVVRPVVAEAAARNAGLTRAQIADAIQREFEGQQVGVYREKDLLLPIIARAPERERDDPAKLHEVRIWSPAARRSIPLAQVVLKLDTVTEDDIVRRRNRLPTITVKCDPARGEATPAFNAVRPQVERRYAELARELELDPSEYTLEWGGEYEDSRDAQGGLASKMPFVAMSMVLIIIILFNSLRKPLVIFLTLPLAIIGVTAGLLVFRQPFGFMALLGFLSLSGMIIKNAVVLIDEINANLAQGRPPFDAVVDSGVSRMRPVMNAAMTTVLGMLPLVVDPFYSAMAVTIMVGLTFATVLTLVFVPILFVIFFRIPVPRDAQ